MRKLKAMAVLSAALATGFAFCGDTAIPQDTMERIAREVATPYKVGMVIAPEKGEKLDGPMVFRQNGKWYMMYVRFDGKGYETMLADSDDLLKWRKLGCILPRGKAGDWDSEQADGVPLLLDPEWEGSNELKSFDGKYWMLYIGGSRKGYEPDPLSAGVAFTDDPSAPRAWTRAKNSPVMSPSDADARPFERKTIYKHYVVEDPSRSLGARFVDYYNGKQNGTWQEKIGMAVSDDLVNWRRYGDKPVIDDCIPGKTGISGDPMIRRIGDVWVMFYFGYLWKPGEKGAFDTFACSRDLVHWTKWTGEPLLRTSEPYDRVHAHKPWVIKHNGVVYHFYCAVGDSGRGLALATSRKLAASDERPMKVLMIGNSFSICNLKQMPHVAKSMGLKLDLASLYIGGCSLERHWNNVVASTNAAFKPYRFDRTTDGAKVVVKGKANIPDALILDKWDVVTIQQASHFSWRPETFQPFGDSLVAKIRELAPQAKIVVQETWSYPPWDRRLKKFGFDQSEMYARLHRTYAEFAAKYGFEVIPVGTAAEFMPNRNALFKKPDFHFNRDGEYLQGLAFTARLFGVDVRMCPYRPAWMESARADEMKAAVMKAVEPLEKDGGI